MKKIITFIIPSYNVEHCLDKCLRSFLELSVLDRMEILIINDGSTDGTEKAALPYIKKYPSSYQIISKANGGHGSAINAGSLAAKGQYFKVIDADDWVVTSHLPEFVRRLEQCQADMVLTPFHFINCRDGSRREQSSGVPVSCSLDMETIVKNWGIYEQCSVFHGITYRTDFYKREFHLLPKHVFYEDQEYSTIPACLAQKIEYWDLPIYQYMVGNTEQSVSFFNQAQRIGHIDRIAKNILSYYNACKDTMSPAGRKYLLFKAENIILIYYMVASIYEADKSKGRAALKTFEAHLLKRSPELYEKLWPKYQFYLAMNRIHIRPELYKAFVESNIYGRIKKKLLRQKGLR